jgi:integrase
MDAEGYLWNPYGKTASSRRKVRLNSVAVEVIKRRMKAAKGLYLFPHKKDKDKPTLKVNNAHDRALEKSGVQPSVYTISGIHGPHALRRQARTSQHWRHCSVIRSSSWPSATFIPVRVIALKRSKA